MKPKIALRNAALAFATFTLAVTSADAANLYWDIDGATPGAGGTAPGGTWTSGGTTWSTSIAGTAATTPYTTQATDDLFFSAGVNATGAFTVTLENAQNAGSLTVQEGAVTISGNNGIINLGSAGGVIRVGNGPTGAALTATIGDNTTTHIGGSVSLTKNGVGTLLLSGTAAHTFTGGLNVNGGTLSLNFANLATPGNFINSGNALALGGSGTLLITGKNSGPTSQTLGNVTVNPGGGRILGNRNDGDALDINLGSLTATAKGGSLLAGAGGSAANIPVITITTAKDASGIYGGRVVYFNGTAGTGYDWATTADESAPFALSAYTGYVDLDLSGGTDAANSRITASQNLAGNRTTNSLKFVPAASGQVLDLGGNVLALSSGGLLITGAAASPGPRIQNGTLTAGPGSNYDIVVHQYNATATTGGAIESNTSILAAITDNGENPVTLVKAGTGTLILRGTNTFTGGIVVNDGGTIGWRTNGTAVLNNNSLTFNANTIVLCSNPATTNGGVTINNGSQIDFRNNTQTFTANGPVTGEGGGITLGQDGGGATRLVFNSTANTFNGPIRYAVTPGGGQAGHLTVNSLADSTTVGEGNLSFGVAGTNTNEHIFTYGTGAITPLVLNNRRIELTGGHQRPVLENNSSQAFTINTDLLSTGTATKDFTLRGNGAGLGTFAGNITQGTITTLNLVKNGSGTWALGGTNSYNGTTTVTAGTLLINGDQSASAGAVAVNGTSTLGGSGTIGGSVTVAAGAKIAPGDSVGTLSILGDLNISAMAGGAGTLNYEVGSIASSDQITVNGTLTIGSGTLGFSDFIFTDLGGMQAGVYKLITSGAPVSGTLDSGDLTGMIGDLECELRITGNDLELVVTADVSADYLAWAAKFPSADLSDPNADFDGDGLSNDQERIFGLDPTDGSSVNPVSVPLDASTGTFSFTRRDPSLSGLIYKVWYSTDLVGWEVDEGATLTPGTVVDEVQTVAVELSEELLDEPRFFIRVGAEEPAPPEPLFFADFEEDHGGFTVVTLGGTAWEWGVPNSPNQGGGAVTAGNGGSQRCWGTNLIGGYAANTDTKLRSPVIDLSGVSGATLSFARAIDATPGHTLEVNVIEAATDTVIAIVITPTQDADPTTSPWQTVGPVAIPAAAIGQTVRIEWRFIGNGDTQYNGAYIDDVAITEAP